jgi:serine/threonine-protein kinase
LGPDHVDVAKTLAGLALDASSQGDMEKALQYAGRAIAIKEKMLGPSHPSVGQTLANRGSDLIDMGRLDEAQKDIERAEAIIRPVSQPSNPWLGSIRNNLAEIYVLRGELDEALRIRRAALAEQTDPTETAGLLSGIGTVLNRLGRYSEALEMHEKSLALKQEALSGEHPDLADALLGIGLAHLGMGQATRAIAPLERAEKIEHLRPRLRGEVRFALARTLAVSRPGEIVRTRALMIGARDDFQSINAKERSEIDAWLARHPAPVMAKP